MVGPSGNLWDDELPSLVEKDAEQAAMEWARLHELPPLADAAAELERVQSIAAATIALHLARRTSEDEPMPPELEAQVLEAARRAGPGVWEELRPADDELVPGSLILSVLGIPLLP